MIVLLEYIDLVQDSLSRTQQVYTPDYATALMMQASLLLLLKYEVQLNNCG